MYSQHASNGPSWASIQYYLKKNVFSFFSTVPILKLYNENTPKLSKTFWVERVQSKR